MTSQQSEPLRSYGGEAGDARVARRRTALMEATLDELAGPEPGSVTVRGICERARLTPRYFYESFAGTDELVGETYDAVIAEIAERALTAFAAGDDSLDKVTGAVTALVDVIESDPRKGRLMFADTLRSPVIIDKRAAAAQLFVRLTSESATQALGLEPGPEVTAAAHFQVGGLGRILASWNEGLLDVDRDQLIGVCVRMLLPEERA
ncbi:MAG: TetR/AcrR family transcriptional regulator [Gordonia sp. (in: high G+C Gram-positive bacteria)]|uniref:TetR/AcrR family transcriptional regulator n=1 Tax=Gordonia sp. (in: high G+C Gram-positive bacteria) TaxID=84139 RepID=UPI0039E2D203